VLVTIIVPTRDRPTALRRCLDALASQDLKDDFEVVVVDDGSVDAAAVAAEVSTSLMARLVRQPPRGPAAARNSGVRAARGRFVCFTDDDCEPHSRWAAHLVAALERGADAVGGRTLPANNSSFARASELVAHAPAFAPPSETSLSFAPSNNLGCSTHLLEVLPFDEGYADAAGEDREWCARLLRTGHSLWHEPSAIIVHRQQLNFRGFLRQQMRYGRGAFRFRHQGQERQPLEKPLFYLGLMRRAFADGVATGLLVCVAQVATGAGFCAELVRGRVRTHQV
jgi:glycosyltransferase involved in cell wall biosynthesis